MPRSEEYLDGLLDSLNEKNNSEKNSDQIASRVSGQSESQYLRDFENDLFRELSSSEEDSFLRDFEKDLGFEIEEGKREHNTFAREKKKRRSVIDEINELENDQDVLTDAPSDSDDSQTIEEIFDNVTSSDSSSGADYSDVEEGLNSVISGESTGGEDEIMDDLVNILSGDSKPEESSASLEEPAASKEPEVAPPDSPAEADDDLLSDIDSDGDLLSDIDSDEAEGASEASPQADTDVPDESGGDAPSETDATSEAGEGNISGEEMMDIEDLLNSIEDEGTLTEAEQDKPATELREEPALAPAKEDEAKGEGEEEKQGFIQKLLGKLFKKKKKGEEGEEASEEGKEEAAAVLAAVQGAEGAEGEDEEDEEDAVDKKQAKKEEKERKKKEKAEAKKKAKAEKEKAAKSKAPKEKKKKKKKQPDTSPKIPIIVIIPFVVLAISIFVLWNVLKENISYNLSVGTARSLYEKDGKYLESYEKLDGIELKDDDLLLAERAMLLSNLEHRWRIYKVYTESQNLSHITALDSLIRGVVFFQDHLEEAEGIAIKDDFVKYGNMFMEALAGYGISPVEAQELIDIRDREKYTKELYAILYRQGLWGNEE